MLDMQIRKCTYTISHIHILTFQNHIRQIINPYFSYEPLEYGVDDEGTLHESIRLIFRSEGFLMQFTKENATLLYEGPISSVKRSNPQVEMFFDIYQKIKGMDGFVKTKTHAFASDFVGVSSKQDHDASLIENRFVNIPFRDVKEYAALFELSKDQYNITVKYGNFHNGDILKSNISPLKTSYNDEINGKYGTMAQIQIQEECATPTFSKFKSLISQAENTLDTYIGNL